LNPSSPLPTSPGIRASSGPWVVRDQHALFAARVQHWPFAALAASTWEDIEHPAQFQLLERHLRFIGALHPGRDRLQPDQRLTLELRYLYRPGAAEIECALLGKAFAPDPENARAAAQALWERVSGAMPVGYGMTLAQTPNEFAALAGEDVIRDSQAQLIEIRRPAEILLWTEEKLPVRHLPVVYPFGWQPSGWEAVWAAQASLNAPSLIAVSLRPSTLLPGDEIAVARMAYVLSAVAAESQPPLSVRAAEAARYFQDLLRFGRSLFAQRVCVVGPEALGQAVLAALSGPGWPRGETESFGLAEIVRPTSEELPVALANLDLLEQAAWGAASLLEPFEQLRYIADAAGALCAFRLPLLPHRGSLGFRVGAEMQIDT
jgi:hypothetical protein